MTGPSGNPFLTRVHTLSPSSAGPEPFGCVAAWAEGAEEVQQKKNRDA